MKKLKLLLPVLFLLYAGGLNEAHGFSIARPVPSQLPGSSLQASDLVKLTFSEYASLTGKKESLWNRTQFKLLKMKVQHDLRKNGDFKLSEYAEGKHHMSTALKILLWTAAGLLFLILVIAVIYGKTER